MEAIGIDSKSEHVGRPHRITERGAEVQYCTEVPESVATDPQNLSGLSSGTMSRGVHGMDFPGRSATSKHHQA